MIRVFDPATDVVHELSPAVGRVLRIGAGGGVRVAVVADLVRRLAERQRWQTAVLGVSSLTDRHLLYLNVHPFHEPGPEVEVWVGTAPGPGRSIVVVEPNGDVDPAAPPEGVDPLGVRVALLQTPYREPVQLSAATVRAAWDRLDRWRGLVAGWAESPSLPMSVEAVASVVDRLLDDLDTPGALAALDAVAADDALAPGARFETFAHLDRLLGLDLAADVGRRR